MRGINRIKIVNCPQLPRLKNSMYSNTLKFPPLGIAQLTGYLREKGFIVDQDDFKCKSPS